MEEMRMKSKLLMVFMAAMLLAGWATGNAWGLFAEMHANYGTITVDGDPYEWQGVNLVDPEPLLIPGDEGQMGLSIHFAFNESYFYILVLETGNSLTEMEAPSIADYTNLTLNTGPWFYDGVSFWMDMDNNNDGKFDFNPWFGFSSVGQKGLMAARVNNVTDVLENRALLNAQCATSGTFAQHNRLIEARIAWADLQVWVDAEAGGHHETNFGCEPMIAENGFIQRFIGGTTVPSGDDAHSIDIHHCRFIPVELSFFAAE
jgi:hypothetical protein